MAARPAPFPVCPAAAKTSRRPPWGRRPKPTTARPLGLRQPRGRCRFGRYTRGLGPAARAATKLAASALLLSAAFSEMISLLMRSPQWKHASLADLEWLLVPALASNQFALAHHRDMATGLSIPVALVTWASVSDDVDQRLTETVAQPLRLKPEEWKSGAHAWIVVAEGVPQAVLEVVSSLRANAFAGREVKMRVIGADGRVSVGVVGGATPT